MEILFNRKPLKVINNHVDLKSFIRDFGLFKYFKSIPNSHIDLINKKINSTHSVNYKSLKSWYREVVNYPESIYNPKFLQMMGWDVNETNNFISEIQKKILK
jgi:hypothetical protein